MMIRRLLLLLCLLAVGVGLAPIADAQLSPAEVTRPADDAPPPPAEDDPAQPPETLASPQATMATFLQAMEDVATDPDGWDRAASTLNIPEQMSDVDRRGLVRQLYGIFNRMEAIDLDRIPADPDYESVLGLHYRFFPQARHDYLLRRLGGAADKPIDIVRSREGAWRFSKQTVRSIPGLWEQMRALPVVTGSDILVPADRLRVRLPAYWKQHLLSLEYWQWVGLFVVIFLGFVIDLLTRVVLRVFVARKIRKQGGVAEPEQLNQSLRPFGLLAAAIGWIILLRLLDLPTLAATILIGAAQVFAVLAGVFTAWRLVDLLCAYFAARASRSRTRFDDVLIPLIRRALKVFIVVIGVIYIAGALEVLDDIWPLLASLGLGSIAFAFAAKDTIENFFGSIAVLLDRPFHVGDWVVIDDHEGIVEQIGFRSTRIRTFYNSLVTVPNANLVRAVVDNYGARKYRRWSTHVGVQYDTPPDKLIAFAEGIREIIRTHPYTRKDYFQVRVHEFAASSLNILLYVFWEVADWSMELRERERLFVDIVRLADQLGVSFAFPTQTVHLYHEQKTAEHQPEHTAPQRTTERRAEMRGIRAAQALMANQRWLERKPGPVIYQEGPTYIEIDPATGEPLDPEAKSAIEDRTAGG